MSSSWSLRRGALCLSALASVAAAGLFATPAFGRVIVVVQSESKKAVRSHVSVRIGHVVTRYDTENDGRQVFDTMNCNARTFLKIEPLVRMYIYDGKWLPCRDEIVLRLRPYQTGEGRTDGLPTSDKARALALAEKPRARG